jgi:ABC-type transporter Mla MlaB component
MQVEVDRDLTIESLQIALVTPRRLRLSGSLVSSTEQLEVERALGNVHVHILTASIALFTVDVSSLSFVDSSAIRLFIEWISLAARARYKLVFITDPTVTWHRLNFAVSNALAPQAVEIGAGLEGLG